MGLDALRDPDPMLDYMTCKQVAADPDDPTNYYNDANYCDRSTTSYYAQQKVELDPRSARRSCTRC